MQRVTNNGKLRAGLVAFGMASMIASTTGCATATVVQAGAADPQAFAMLPLALLIDGVAAAFGGGKDHTSTTVAAAPPDMSGWSDPDDWVGSCSGPLMCPPYKVFECSGVPGDCYCDCVVGDDGVSIGMTSSDAMSSAAQATASTR